MATETMEKALNVRAEAKNDPRLVKHHARASELREALARERSAQDARRQEHAAGVRMTPNVMRLEGPGSEVAKLHETTIRVLIGDMAAADDRIASLEQAINVHSAQGDQLRAQIQLEFAERVVAALRALAPDLEATQSLTKPNHVCEPAALLRLGLIQFAEFAERLRSQQSIQQKRGVA